MAIIQKSYNGQNFAQNIIDPLLVFDEGTWTISSGTGTASLSSSNPFVGNRALRLQNNTPADDLIATNSTQSTTIAEGGIFQISLYCRKIGAIGVRNASILIYQNAALLDTQTIELGSVDVDEDEAISDKWIRYVADTEYTFVKSDVITFQFQIDGIVIADATNTIEFDGLMLNKSERFNRFPPLYNEPTDTDLYNQFTGWGDYVDGVYTTGSPFTATDGVKTDLPNDAATTRETQKPIDITTFYDGTVITGRDGDGINITIEFKCRPTTAASNVRVQVAIDIGGAVGEIYTRDFNLTKGSGIEHYYLSSFNAYTLDTWESNGGTVKVTAVNDDVEIYDIRYIITRTHKAR